MNSFLKFIRSNDSFERTLRGRELSKYVYFIIYFFISLSPDFRDLRYIFDQNKYSDSIFRSPITFFVKIFKCQFGN